jgi:hypothetical protein
LTRHEDRYAQVISEAGQAPSGDTATDEGTAIGTSFAVTGGDSAHLTA